jgi:peptide deformylase
MALRNIVILPDNILKQQSAPFKTVDAETRQLADDMLDTMYHAPGIGLAAVQIGLLQQMIVVDVAREDDPKDPICMINPKVIWSSKEMSEYEEGCLSIPDTYDLVTRPAEVKVQYLDREGAECERHCDGLLSTCIQHEIDHLNGILFIDYLSRLKRERIIKKFVKAAKHTGTIM